MISEEYAKKVLKLSKLYKELYERKTYFEFKQKNGFIKINSLPTINSNLDYWRVAKLKEVDWLKVPFGTIVQVSDLEDSITYDRTFICYMPNKNQFLCFANGDTQYTAISTTIWRNCKLHKCELINKKDIKDEWLKE